MRRIATVTGGKGWERVAHLDSMSVQGVALRLLSDLHVARHAALMCQTLAEREHARGVCGGLTLALQTMGVEFDMLATKT